MEGATRIWLLLAGLNGLLAVGFGAFAAHGVSDPQVKEWLRTGAQYQLVHAAAGLACFALLRFAIGPAGAAGWLFGLGALVFGGSLYALAFTGVRTFGALAPIGGLLLILGWVAVIWAVLSNTVAARVG
jgi:uncharacterized membrane protein YgdD (TMEM256/DUF423 family)